MAPPKRAPHPLICPSCGTVSLKPPHYCAACGFDFWRSAPRGLVPAPPITAVAPWARRDLPAALVGTGIAWLIVVVIAIALILLGGFEARPGIGTILPPQGPEDHLILRFFREARSPRAAFSMVAEGTMLDRESAVDPGTPASTSLVMHAADWIKHVTFSADGDTVEESSAEIGGQYFERLGADSWIRTEPRRALEPASPFARISTVTEIEYVGSETNDGGTVHHLLVTKWLGETVRDLRVRGFDDITDRQNRLDIWVSDDGVPIRAELVATIEAREDGLPYTSVMQVSFVFSEWGAIESLEPPA